MQPGGREAVSAGQSGERVAAAYLADLGYLIVGRNFRCYVGELDIVAVDTQSRDLVFIEVKSFKTNSFLNPLEAISKKKATRLHKTAQYFLLRHPQFQKSYMRFDAIAVEGQKVTVHLKNVLMF